MEMTYKEIIEQVSLETGLPKALVDKTYKSYWRVVREHISSLPLKEDISDEEFLKLKPNVNIPSLGKLSVTLEDYKRKKKEFLRLTELKNATHKEN